MKVLEDKAIIPYWYKRPDHSIQNQLKDMIDITKLKDLIQLDIAIGGDHGGGKFHVTMKVNFCLPEKKTVSYLTQLASVSFSKDDINNLKDTGLDPIGEGLQLIAEGGRFIVSENLAVTFSGFEVAAICNCSINIYLGGDLKFYAQMSGRDGMSSYWCMWQMLHPAEW